MPTTKCRVNLTVPSDLQFVLEKLAKRDDASVSAKTLELVRMAIEIEEDAGFLQLAQERTKKKGNLSLTKPLGYELSRRVSSVGCSR